MLTERQDDHAAAILGIERISVERQESGARLLTQQKSERGADGGVSEAGQRLGCHDDVPDPADVGKRDQKRRFAFGASQRRHEFRFLLVPPCGERPNERVQRFRGRAPEQPDEPDRVFPDERPQIRRMIGEAEKDIPRPAAFKLGLKLHGRRALEQRLESATRFGRRGESGRVDEALSERCGHSRPARRAPATEAGRPRPAR